MGECDLDALLHLESEWEAVRELCILEGQSLGREKGRELGHELGFYAGCAECWLARYQESEQGTREDETEAPAATAATAAGRRLVAEMPKEVPHEVRHLLAGADWSAPNCKARAAKTLEQIIQLVDTFPVDDLTNEAVSDTIDKIRGKFKSAVSQLGMVRGDVTKQGGLAF